MFKTLTKDEFKKYLENDEFILVDIRTDREREIYGQIQDKQINIDFYCPKIKTNILALVKSKKYLIYCWH
jgi:rhodanese-related sulfurtransferase